MLFRSTGVAAAGGLAFINSIGTVGGFVGPYAVGWLKDATGQFSAGLVAMAALLALSTVMAFWLERVAAYAPARAAASRSARLRQ